MRLAGYDDAAINTVVKALVAQTDDEIKPAWEVLGGEHGGVADAGGIVRAVAAASTLGACSHYKYTVQLYYMYYCTY